MRKRVFGQKLSRSRKGRVALLRSLLRALILNGKITTTKARTKYLVSEFDKLLNIAKKDGFNSRRVAMEVLGNQKDLISPLFGKIVPSFKDVQGGYLRVTPLVSRKGDSAPMGIVEFSRTLIVVEAPVKKEKVKKVKTEVKKTKSDPKAKTDTKKSSVKKEIKTKK